MADRTLEVALRATAGQFISETNRAEEAVARLHKELEDTQAARKAAEALAKLKREIRLSEEGQRAEATLRRLAGSTRETGDAMDLLVDRAKGAAASLAGAAAAYVSISAAIAGVSRLLGDSFTRLQDGEREAVLLAASFKFTGEQTEYLASQVAQLSADTKLLPGDLTKAQAAILKFGASRSELEGLLPAAANIARAFNVDVADAAQALARGIAGDGESLRAFGVVVTASMEKSQKLAKVLEAGARAAEANKLYNDTFADSVDGVRLAWDNLTSRLGDALKEEGVATLQFLEKATKATEGWVDKLDKAGAFDWARIGAVLTGKFPTLEEARRAPAVPLGPPVPRDLGRRRPAPEFGRGIETTRDQLERDKRERERDRDRKPPRAQAADNVEELNRRAYDLAIRTAALTYNSLREREDVTLKILRQEASDTRLTLDTRLAAEERIKQIIVDRAERERTAAEKLAELKAKTAKEFAQAEEDYFDRLRAQEQDAIQAEIREREEAAQRISDITVTGAREATRILSRLAAGQGLGAGDIASGVGGLVTAGATIFGGPLAGGIASLIVEPIAAFFQAQDDREKANAERLRAAAENLAQAGKTLREKLGERVKEAYLSSLPADQRAQARRDLERKELLGEIRSYASGLGLTPEQISQVVPADPKFMGQGTDPVPAGQRRTQFIDPLTLGTIAVIMAPILGAAALGLSRPKKPKPEEVAPAPEPAVQVENFTETVPTVTNVGVSGAQTEIRSLVDLLEAGLLDKQEPLGQTEDRPLYVYDTARQDVGFGFASRSFFFRGRIGTPRTSPGAQAQGLSGRGM